MTHREDNNPASIEPSTTLITTDDSTPRPNPPPIAKRNIRLYTLTCSSPATEITPILNLSNSIFDIDPTIPDHPQGSPTKWTQKLSDPRSIIVVASSSSTSEPNTTEPVGFFFSYPRTNTEPDLPVQTMHVWLAGISPSARNRGIFPLLLAATKTHARTVGLEWLTVCTIPERFGRMYAVLSGSGWEFVGYREGDGVGMRKRVVMKLRA